MKKRVAAMILSLCVALCAFPASSLAARAKQMNDGVPVWNEKTVKEYVRDFIAGNDLERLYGYYDLQIRRYMPMSVYEAMLTELHWMTGEFIEFGTYSSFAEPEWKTKTHVLHLCMEKQDLDLYFVHKDKPDDWEVMALELVPSEKQPISDGRDMLVVEGEDGISLKNAPTYTQLEVTVGEAPYELKGILTLPQGADAEHPVPGCVLVHDQGPWDMDGTLGQTKLLADIADMFARRGIATLRYDKRTYAYGGSMTQGELEGLSLEEEVIQDALSAGRLLRDQEAVNGDQLMLVGHGLGAMLAPQIASEATGLFDALLMIGGAAKASSQQPALAELDQIRLLRKLRLPTYFVQGNQDAQVSVGAGVDAYEDQLGPKAKWAEYAVYRGLNHLLMKSTGGGGQETAEGYHIPTKLDAAAARNMAAWIHGLWNAQEEGE